MPNGFDPNDLRPISTLPVSDRVKMTVTSLEVLRDSTRGAIQDLRRAPGSTPVTDLLQAHLTVIENALELWGAK